MPSCVIRQGALGDFILTVPLLKALAERDALHLICSRRHYELISRDIEICRWIDCDSADAVTLYSDSPNDTIRSLLNGCEIHSFQRLNIPDMTYHDPRPTTPPSAARRFLNEAGFEPSDDFEQIPPLLRRHSTGDRLWIHTGSGSKAKNVPPEFWIDKLKDTPRRRIVLSFGECELESDVIWRNVFRNNGFDFECVKNPSLTELRQMLEENAAEYWGVDTGVTHLAAALGIPVKAVFVCTDSRIWRPLGNVSIIQVKAANGN